MLFAILFAAAALLARFLFAATAAATAVAARFAALLRPL
jgi:hypothetical protein